MPTLGLSNPLPSPLIPRFRPGRFTRRLCAAALFPADGLVVSANLPKSLSQSFTTFAASRLRVNPSPGFRSPTISRQGAKARRRTEKIATGFNRLENISRSSRRSLVTTATVNYRPSWHFGGDSAAAAIRPGRVKHDLFAAMKISPRSGRSHPTTNIESQSFPVPCAGREISAA